MSQLMRFAWTALSTATLWRKGSQCWLALRRHLTAQLVCYILLIYGQSSHNGQGCAALRHNPYPEPAV